ncbi:MAG: serine endoprotease DegQ, partial [Gammaproteobacteria bacterium]|nr:serine endoprotease DegQ [Gammaproteobacteria bacterium]
MGVTTIFAALPATDSQQQPLPTLAPMLEKTVPAVVNIFTATHIEVKQNPLL